MHGNLLILGFKKINLFISLPGSGLTGIRGFKRGKASVLRARDVAFSMPLTGETARCGHFSFPALSINF